MTVSADIIQLLQKQNVNYEISESQPTLTAVPSENHSMHARSLVLKDGDNHVQIVFPANNFVDLDAMFRQFGREFTGAPPHELLALGHNSEFNSIPAVPGWQDLPLIVDEQLFKAENILLEAGSDSHLLTVNQEDFRGMFANAKKGYFTRKIPALHEDSTHDSDDIHFAVEKFTQRRVHQRLDETLEMPPLPQTAQKIINLRADPNADINDLVNAVELDPSLAAQVVSWAASPYYSAPGKIKSVHDAIVRVLGFDMVLNLALGLSLGKTLSTQVLSANHIENYWKRSIYSAAAVEGSVTSISREHRPAFGMSYLAGLLSNYGYLIMAEVFPPYFENLERLSLANPHLPLSSIEKCLMGITGNQMASYLMDNWNMPKELVIALRQQDNLEYEGEHKEYARLIYVANQLLANQGVGRALQKEIPQHLYEELHLDEELSKKTIDNILQAGDDLEAITNQANR